MSTPTTFWHWLPTDVFLYDDGSARYFLRGQEIEEPWERVEAPEQKDES